MTRRAAAARERQAREKVMDAIDVMAARAMIHGHVSARGATKAALAFRESKVAESGRDIRRALSAYRRAILAGAGQ